MTPFLGLLMLMGAEFPGYILALAIIADTIILSVGMATGFIHR